MRQSHLVYQFAFFLLFCLALFFSPAFFLPLWRAFFTPEEFEESHRRPTRAQVNILPLFWTFGSNPLHVKQLWISASGKCDAYSVIYYVPTPQMTILLPMTNHTCKNLTSFPTMQLFFRKTKTSSSADILIFPAEDH